MHFTLWPSRTANEGAHAEITWEAFLSFVAAPQLSASKDSLEGWSPARFKDNRRSRAACELVSAIVLDDDSSGLSTEQLAGLWAGSGAVIHTSFSHAIEAPKHRLIFPVSRDMTMNEHAAVWRHVRDMAASKGQSLDEVTRDPSRLWYVPACRDLSSYCWCVA